MGIRTVTAPCSGCTRRPRRLRTSGSTTLGWMHCRGGAVQSDAWDRRQSDENYCPRRDDPQAYDRFRNIYYRHHKHSGHPAHPKYSAHRPPKTEISENPAVLRLEPVVQTREVRPACPSAGSEFLALHDECIEYDLDPFMGVGVRARCRIRLGNELWCVPLSSLKSTTGHVPPHAREHHLLLGGTAYYSPPNCQAVDPLFALNEPDTRVPGSRVNAVCVCSDTHVRVFACRDIQPRDAVSIYYGSRWSTPKF